MQLYLLHITNMEERREQREMTQRDKCYDEKKTLFSDIAVLAKFSDLVSSIWPKWRTSKTVFRGLKSKYLIGSKAKFADLFAGICLPKPNSNLWLLQQIEVS